MRVSPLCLVFGLIVNAHAADVAQGESEDSQPSMELLEFIGEWETPDGGWFDPMDNSEETGSQEEQNDE